MANGLKQEAARIAAEFWPDRTVEVRGTRIKGRFGGEYLVELDVDDSTVVRERHRDWRKAYRMLATRIGQVAMENE